MSEPTSITIETPKEIVVVFIADAGVSCVHKVKPAMNSDDEQNSVRSSRESGSASEEPKTNNAATSAKVEFGGILTPSHESLTYRSTAYEKIIVKKPKICSNDLETEVDIDSDATESVDEKINIPSYFVARDLPTITNMSPFEGRHHHSKRAAANTKVAKPQSKKVECYDDSDVDDDWEFSQMHLM